MNLVVGYIPYLNMEPFHQHFGPECMEVSGHHIDFRPLSPKALGLEAEKGLIDAGALSLVDSLRLPAYEPLGNFGIGMRGPAESVLFFSKMPMAEFSGAVSVTDETATSVRLLQILLEKRYGRAVLQYGRISSALLYDGTTEGLLLIGDEALKARAQGIRGLPFVSDLGSEWIDWKGTPFAFARWMVKVGLGEELKTILSRYLENSLNSIEILKDHRMNSVIARHGLLADDVRKYWQAFEFRLTPAHDQSVQEFRRLSEDLCLTA